MEQLVKHALLGRQSTLKEEAGLAGGRRHRQVVLCACIAVLLLGLQLASDACITCLAGAAFANGAALCDCSCSCGVLHCPGRLQRDAETT
jgi:hypothetical protein